LAFHEMPMSVNTSDQTLPIKSTVFLLLYRLIKKFNGQKKK
jgi:hypothetical protein